MTKAMAVVILMPFGVQGASTPAPGAVAPSMSFPLPSSPDASAGRRTSMIFPAPPPPLGAVVPRRAPQQPPLSEDERALSGEVLEVFFAPLSTYRIEPWRTMHAKAHALLEDYRRQRAALVAELRRVIADVEEAPAATKLAGFSALATAQEARLVSLEDAAEVLRSMLARETNWNERREWNLDARDLETPGGRNMLLEYLVVRAAAFYQGGLTAAQRRLLREAASDMEDALFNKSRSARGLFRFFSPDLMLVQFPEDLPASTLEKLELHRARKEALREELRETIYRTDGGSGFARSRRLRQLAEEQSPRIEALEDLAEVIRRELAAHDTSWRRSPPAALPDPVQRVLQAFLAAKQQLDADYLAIVEPIVSTPPSASVRADAKALQAWREEFHARVEEATTTFRRQRAEDTARLEQQVPQVDEALVPHYHPLDLAPTPEARLMNFVHRRRVESAYHEYDIAAFEPGLSPRQRALLFAAAVANLDLALPASEESSTTRPATLLK